MKAAVLFSTDRPLEIVDGIEIPKLEVGQVLVKLAYSGVCHSQLMESRGKRGIDKWLPHLLGHEGTGIVEDVGLGVSQVKRGDKVILGWLKGRGLNANGAKYQYKNIVINSGGVTTFSTHTVVSENRCYKIPDGLPLDLGVLFGCAIPTGAGIVMNDLRPKPETTIGVIGIGGIGLSALMVCNTIKFAKVIAIDISDSKLELAKKIGATDIINPRIEDVKSTINRLTDKKGLDYCIEAAGQIKTIEMGFDLIKSNGGMLVFASHPPTGEKISLDPHALISGKGIRGTWGGASEPERDIPEYFKLYREGVLNLDLMIDKKYCLEDINTALNDLEANRVIRPLIEIDGSL